LFSHVTKIPQQKFKVVVFMSKVLVPFLVKCGVLKGVDIVVRIRVFSIYVQACVVKNNDVVHGIYFLLSIKPRLMTLVLPRLLDLN
jgi:hypothetical protein